MSEAQLDEFVDMACRQVMFGAAEYIKQYAKGTVITDELMTALKDATKAVFDSAMADAKAAIECNMAAYASTTFSASMRLAGYQAAEAHLC